MLLPSLALCRAEMLPAYVRRSEETQPVGCGRALAVLSGFEEKHPGALQIYTNGSVHKDRTSSTAVLTVPLMSINWRGCLLRSSSSMAAELTAIKEAVGFAETVFFKTKYALARQPLVILTDSRSAIQKLARVRFDDETLKIWSIVYCPTSLGHCDIAMGAIPSWHPRERTCRHSDRAWTRTQAQRHHNARSATSIQAS